MPKSNQIGFLVEDMMASQLSFNLIKNINSYAKNRDDDIVVFFENATSSILVPNFSLMSINEIWNFSGSLFATNVFTALSMQKAFAPKNKLFYVWDLEWTRAHGKDFEFIIRAFSDKSTTLIARSDEHARAIENYCNRSVNNIVSDFNIEQLVRISNE
tara:strand:- start:15224 stop:15697 length:474 start_codon:yes stop_codon:yes gene_type:complete